MHGYAGKILRIDLTNEKARVLRLKLTLLKKFLGGKGLGAKLLYDNLKPETNPYDPENLLIFMTGPLAGTMVPTSSRYAIITKSPLTGIFLDTYSGGHFAHEMKLAGYDGVVIMGKSKKPSYLWINDDKIQFMDAKNVWGKTTYETDIAVKEEIGNPHAKVACIGPAGENLVRFACVINDKYDAAGRGGAGAVMGSKNLKAIAVYGTRKVSIAKMDELSDIVSEAHHRIKNDAFTGQTLPTYGTPNTVWSVQQTGIFPTRNFRSGVFEGAEHVDGEVLRRYLVRNAACRTCPIGCGKKTYVKSGKYAGVSTEGPEYETLWAFSAQCGNSDFESIIQANDLCNLYGLDTISTGNVIGFAMECFEKNKLSEKDLGDQDLSFGNSEAIIESIKRIAYREGYGNLLAEGVKRVAERLHATDFAQHVKGLELPGYDPRGSKGMGLAYATSNRGGCHNRAWVVGIELFTDVDRFETRGKARIVKYLQDYGAVKDSLIMCHFLFSPNNPVLDESFATKMLTAVTGLTFTEKDLLGIGERIWNLERVFNAKVGMRRRDDTLPKRLLREEMPEGPSRGHVVELEKMLNDYYELRNWDKETGIPTKEKLLELNLVNVADDLIKLEMENLV